MSSRRFLPTEVGSGPLNNVGLGRIRTSFEVDGTLAHPFVTYADALTGLATSTTDHLSLAPGHAFGEKRGTAGFLTQASVARSTYTWQYYTASCYIKIYWDIVVQDAQDSHVVVSTTPMDLEVFCSGNPCIPLGSDVDYPYFRSTVYALEPTEPPDPTVSPFITRYETYIKNLRWSCISGYIPPTDGSGNGFFIT